MFDGQNKAVYYENVGNGEKSGSKIQLKWGLLTNPDKV